MSLINASAYSSAPKKKKKSARLTPKLKIPEDLLQRLEPSWGYSMTCPIKEVAEFCAPHHKDMIRISIPAMPMSLNAIWRRMGRATVLHPDAKTFREMMATGMGEHRRDRLAEVMSKPFRAVVVLEHTRWFTLKGNPSIADIDNRMKTVFDALCKACGQDLDHNLWDLHAYKLQSWEDRTTVYLLPKRPEDIVKVEPRDQT